jgi:hypothetical protein
VLFAFVRTAIEKAEYNDVQNHDGEFGAATFHEFPEYDRDLGVEALFVLLSAGSLVWILAVLRRKPATAQATRCSGQYS